LIRRFLQGVFSEGIDVEDEDSLLKLLKEVGVDLSDFKAQREKGVFSAQIQRDEDEAGKLGINSIPHIIIDGKYTVSGAQSPEYFLDLLQKAYNN
jgi:predicted DsbA family dithiol-disulfide isomerase